MKFLLLFSALVMLCSPFAPSGANVTKRHSGDAVAQSGGEELASVLRLLEKTLRRDSYVFVGGSWHRLTSWKARGCELTYVITDEGVDVRRLDRSPSMDVKRHRHEKFELDLSRLDPDGVKANRHRDAEGGTIFYRTHDWQKHIRYELDYPKRAEQWPIGWFYLKDRESLNHAASMLREAIAICRR